MDEQFARESMKEVAKALRLPAGVLLRRIMFDKNLSKTTREEATIMWGWVRDLPNVTVNLMLQLSRMSRQIMYDDLSDEELVLAALRKGPSWGGGETDV